ncbi:uncharacterized protein SPPG_01450 [Spizellomyces punctatus DAOM BR117]|uniref:Uncharacterized protein n=1 Tax=Spizellomyces punctatus (strain DAOM BR117) TaxID=645134 RepID=A0A0L0HSF0_SPIPD|nr:uncharacterized protein SPPG_01450 [Spizellomyces punctatus DAOM BR117]KND04002.1 hypothetical protein SPPG_01450 [Spizellomyces punctatus DAOM BR117]|eukprot:XP_016612041.1 hypothetical protein SPPG_01450 [Spizellomyces punctatus DAOM BR117]
MSQSSSCMKVISAKSPMDEPAETKKRPLDLAALRQKQLQKRRKAASESQSTARNSDQKPQQRSSLSGRLSSGPFLAPCPLFPKIGRPPRPQPVDVEQIQPPCNLLPASALTSTTKANASLNPFAASIEEEGELRVKKKNPFSVIDNICESRILLPNDEDSASIAGDGFELLDGGMGEHVSQALQTQLGKVSKLAPSLSRSFSCPAGLATPHISLSKKSRGSLTDFLEASSHYKDDSDASVTSEDEEAASHGYMSDVEQDCELQGLCKETELTPASCATDEHDAQRELRINGDDVKPNDQEVGAGNSTGFLDLIIGKRLERGGITEQEILAIAELTKVRKTDKKTSPAPEPPKCSSDIRGTESVERVANSNELPMDWTIKTGMTILSRKPFACASEGTSDEQSGYLLHFVQHRAEDPKDLPKNQTFGCSIYPYLYHWTYPPDKLAPSNVALMAKVLAKEEDEAGMKDYERLELAHFRRCEEAWKEAFQSVYAMTRNGHAEYFFYINSQFSVVLFSGDKDSSKECDAFMSTSTAGIRKCLDAEGIQYHLVFGDRGRVFRRQDRSEVDGAPLFSKKPGNDDGSKTSDGGESSGQLDRSKEKHPLRFNGYANVHRLFNFLLNWKEPQTERRAMQLPTLLCATPFMNASLKTAKILKNEKVRYNDVEDPVGGKMIETMHKLQISGFILPTSAYDMLTLLRAQQVIKDPSGGLLMVTVKTEERTVGLNAGLADKAETGKTRQVATVNTIACRGNVLRWK